MLKGQPGNGRSILPAGIAVAVLGLCALWLVVFSLRDYDTFWHLANGRAMIEQGRIIHEEIFSYSAAGTPFANHSWLAQIAMYLCYAAAGPLGLIGFKLLLTTALLVLIYRTSRLFGASIFFAGFAAYACVFVGLTRFVARPQLFSYAGLALLAWVLFGFLKGRYAPRVLCLLPLLMVLWDCLHGAIFGYVLWGAVAAGETLKLWLPGRLRSWQQAALPSRRQVGLLWGWLAIALSLSLLKPQGLELYGAVFEAAQGNFIFNMTAEFMPTATFGSTFWPFWVLLGLLSVACLWNWRRLDLTQLLVLLPFAYLGVRYSRCVEVFAIVATPVVAAWLSAVATRWKPQRKLAVLAGCVPLLVAAVVLWGTAELKGKPLMPGELDTSGVRTGWSIKPAYLPLGAVDFIKTADLQGNMFNSDRFGGLLAYFLAPERKIFHYNHPRIFQEIYAYLHNPGARDKWQHTYALVAKPEEVSMFQSRNWITVYRDPVSMVMVAPEPQLLEVIRRYRVNYFDPLAPVESVRQQLRQPQIAASLVREIANYLSFNRDESYCQLLVEGLTSGVAGLSSGEVSAYGELALRNNARSATLVGFMGLQYYRAGNLSQALASLEQARMLAPDSAFVLINLGFVLLDRQEPERAIEVFRALLAQDKDDLNAVYGLGRALLTSGQPGEGRPLLESYLRQAPNGRFAPQTRLLLQ